MASTTRKALDLSLFGALTMTLVGVIFNAKWTRGAQFATLLLGVAAAGMAVADHLNDDDEKKADPKQLAPASSDGPVGASFGNRLREGTALVISAN